MATDSKKIIMITGGTGYLGTAITATLTAAGFVVKNIPRDITNEVQVKRLAEEVASEYGTIAGLVHAAAAPLVRKPLLSQSAQEFASQFNVNVEGAFIVCKYFCPLLAPGAALIGILSKGMDEPAAKSGSYIPAKYALRGFLKLLSVDLAERQVRVFGVSPAFMPGGLNKDLPQGAIDFIVKKSPTGDVTSPEEVAALIAQLCTSQSEAGGALVRVPKGASEPL